MYVYLLLLLLYWFIKKEETKKKCMEMRNEKETINRDYFWLF